jgi:hypothetical protein
VSSLVLKRIGTRRAVEAVDTAVHEGRIDASQSLTFIKAYDSDPLATAAMLDGLPAVYDRAVRNFWAERPKATRKTVEYVPPDEEEEELWALWDRYCGE